MQRDPERTRRRILAAAEKEFSAKGFAGARVDAIARRAHVNKRMLYHYFGNKEGLYREILLQKLTREDSPFRFPHPEPARLIDALLYFNETATRNVDFIRLLEWEGLTAGGRRVIGEEERRRDEEETVERVRRAQAAGLMPPDLDARHLLLSLMALNSFPLAFPQMTRLVTGLAPTDPEFRRQRVEFLRGLARYLDPCSEQQPPPEA